MQDDTLEPTTSEPEAGAPESTDASPAPDDQAADTAATSTKTGDADETVPVSEGAVVVDGLIFDLDGTLVDSRADLAASINALREARQLEPLSVEDVAQHVGNGIYHLVGQALGIEDEDAIDEAVEAFAEHYAEHCLDSTQAFPGATEILDHFKNKPCAVVSNKPEEFCRKILRGLGLDKNLMAIIGGDTVDEQKPHPMPFQEALELMGVDPDNVVTIGDDLNDLQGGKSAGTKTCAVTYGFGNGDTLRAAAPDFVADELGALVQMFA